jgi:hypothetical protein
MLLLSLIATLYIIPLLKIRTDVNEGLLPTLDLSKSLWVCNQQSERIRGPNNAETCVGRQNAETAFGEMPAAEMLLNRGRGTW